MAKYVSNDWYLSVGGVDMSAYAQAITLTPVINSVITTAGSGQDDVQRAEGLMDHTISFTIYSDDAGAYALTKLKGTQTVIYGEQGSATGKPKHTQSFILTPVHTTAVEKTQVAYAVTGEGADTPTDNMFAGDVWA